MGGFFIVMPRVVGGGGVTKLSELTIDVSKDWAGYRIRNLGEPADSGDALRLPWNHASRHAPGGGDPLGNLSRSQVSDFWTSPFWGEIPDKPSTFPPSPHASSHAVGGADALSNLSRSMLSDLWNSPFWNNIPDKPSKFPPSAHSSSHAPGGSDALSGLSRSQVSDFFSSPFWNNIPDRPSTYPPSPHASAHNKGGADPLTSLDAGVITSGTLSLDRLPSVPPSKLDATDTPANGEVPSYNAAAGKFEWVAAGGGGGVTRLSELEIDVDKDWAGKNITNFGPGGVDLYSLLTSHASRHSVGGADAIISSLDPRALRYGMQKLADYTFSANGTRVTFTNLDLTTHKFYFLIISVINPTSYNTSVCCYVNGQTDPSDYYSQYICADGTSISAGRSNNSEVLYVIANSVGLGVVWLAMDGGDYPRMCALNSDTAPFALRLVARTVAYKHTINNVTSIDLITTTTNAFGERSRIILYGGTG
jgi:hypothetical protein